MAYLFTAGVFKGRCISGGSLSGEVTEIEWNNFIRFYLKPGKAPGPSKENEGRAIPCHGSVVKSSHQNGI